MKSPRLVVVVSACAVAWVACGAPRDPDLELRVMKARAAALAAKDAPPGQAPAAAPEGATSKTNSSSGSSASTAPDATKAAPSSNLPIKTYTTDEMAAILAGVAGAGKSLIVEVTLAPAAAPAPQGSFTCTLDGEHAPQTVANFVGLISGQAQWTGVDGAPVKQPLYDGLSFHRIQANYIIQTGNPTGKVNAGPGWRLAREPGTPEAFESAGALAMLDDGDAIHGSQFFVTVRPAKGLARQYVAFGRCTNPELVRQIANAETLPDPNGKTASVPKDPTKIATIKVRRGD